MLRTLTATTLLLATTLPAFAQIEHHPTGYWAGARNAPLKDPQASASLKPP